MYENLSFPDTAFLTEIVPTPFYMQEISLQMHLPVLTNPVLSYCSVTYTDELGKAQQWQILAPLGNSTTILTFRTPIYIARNMTLVFTRMNDGAAITNYCQVIITGFKELI